MRHPMIRTFIIAVALMFTLTAYAAAQKKVTVEQALAQLHGLCEQDYNLTASETKRRPSICGDFRQKRPMLQFLKSRVITGFLQLVTQ
jgi:hypothetical protein